MSEISISNKVLVTLKPKAKPYFLRDNNLKGFAVKVNPSGKITFIVEVWPKREAKRKTLGTHLSFKGQRPGQNWRVSEPFAGIWGQLSTP